MSGETKPDWLHLLNGKHFATWSFEYTEDTNFDALPPSKETEKETAYWEKQFKEVLLKFAPHFGMVGSSGGEAKGFVNLDAKLIRMYRELISHLSNIGDTIFEFFQEARSWKQPFSKKQSALFTTISNRSISFFTSMPNKMDWRSRVLGIPSFT